MFGIKIFDGLNGLACGAVFLATMASAVEFDHTHALFNNVLVQYVKDARVDYASLETHPQELNRYLDQVAAVSEPEFKRWDESQQIAFLSNAYNAYTLRLIIEHYPVESIKDIGGFFNGPWDQPVVKLFGKTIDLNTVEHEILRVDYAEPRIHFALVCAAKGCPPLRSEAFVGIRLDEQLEDQERQFLATPDKNRIAAAERTVFLSPIFKWYGGDFGKEPGSVLAALKPYWPDMPGGLDYDDFKIRYTDYDWSLNEQPRE